MTLTGVVVPSHFELIFSSVETKWEEREANEAERNFKAIYFDFLLLHRRRRLDYGDEVDPLWADVWWVFEDSFRSRHVYHKIRKIDYNNNKKN